MSAKTSIEWTDHTFNPWEGCAKVAPECAHCYAETLVDHRFGRAKWGKGQPRRRTSESTWKQPLVWNKIAERQRETIHGKVLTLVRALHSEVVVRDEEKNEGYMPILPWKALRQHRPRVFCLSLGDWLDEEVPIEWFVNLLEIIHATRNLDWQLLTKRPQNWQQRTSAAFQFAMDNGADHGRQMDFTDWLGAWTHAHIAPANIWIGVSAGADQRGALNIPAKIHFLSCEPMLHAMDVAYVANFDWVILGGESGKNARPCDVDWIRFAAAYCRAKNIPVFVKQLGSRPFENHAPANPTLEEEQNWQRNGWCKISFADGSGRGPVWNKNYRLRDSHGGDMEEWPEDFRVREFPSATAK